MTAQNDAVGLREALAPEVIAAAWKAWHARHGGKLGPGPAFTEAIEAGLTVALATLRVEVERVKADQHAMLILVGEHARARGEAEGALAISEKAGIVEGWRDRALAAEAHAARLTAELAGVVEALELIANPNPRDGMFLAGRSARAVARAARAPITRTEKDHA